MSAVTNISVMMVVTKNHHPRSDSLAWDYFGYRMPLLPELWMLAALWVAPPLSLPPSLRK